MMLEHPINAIMNSAMENLKEMVDVDTIVGDAITTPDGTLVIPVSKVSFGLAAGGGEYSAKQPKAEQSNPFAGGVGAGVTINPMAFLVVSKDDVRLLPVEGEDAYSKLLSSVPSMVNKLTSVIGKKKDKENIITEE